MNYYEGLAALAGIYCIGALGLYFPLLTGQVSVGHGALMGVGAYLAGYLTVTFGWSLTLGLFAGLVITAVVGFLVGIVALRFQGLYLAMATLAFGELVRVFFNNSETFGAASGMGGMTGTTVTLVFSVLAVVIIIAHFVQYSRIGRSMRAVGIDEKAAEVIGMPTTAIKIGAFTVGAAITGLAGGLYAHYAFYIEPAFFGFHMSIMLLMMVILGGSRTYWGAIAGAILFSLLPEILIELHLQDLRMVVYGLIVAAAMVIRPQGLVGSEWSILRRGCHVRDAQSIQPGAANTQMQEVGR